jgi:ABC-type multidrug transport system fused ATPase/permease subunit
LNFAFYGKAQTAQLMSRAKGDVEAVRMFLSQGMLTLLQTTFLMLGIAYLLISMDWRLALMTLAFVSVIAWRAITVSGRLRPIWIGTNS